MKRLQIICSYLASASLSAPAFAQADARPDPTDPMVSVPPVIYVPPWKQYRPFGNAPVTSWKSANELVEKIGGWQVYTKEAQESAPSVGEPASAGRQSAPDTKPSTPGGHAGHHAK